MSQIKVAVHKFSSCDGCQLAFLNLGADLLLLADLVDIKHFAEAGVVDESVHVNVAFVEGSVSTNKERQRIVEVRKNTDYLITIGACATSGGIQALRNMNDGKAWIEAVYAKPEYIDSLDKVLPIAECVKVDFELWGCPVSSEQIVTTIRSLLSGVTPKDNTEKVCMECKRKNNVCTLVTKGDPCLGPVTKAGCGAICPSFGRACYACYGPASHANTASLSQRLIGIGLTTTQVSEQFQLFNNNAPQFKRASDEVLRK